MNSLIFSRSVNGICPSLALFSHTLTLTVVHIVAYNRTYIPFVNLKQLQLSVAFPGS
jgi:hypothetical protein